MAVSVNWGSISLLSLQKSPTMGCISGPLILGNQHVGCTFCTRKLSLDALGTVDRSSFRAAFCNAPVPREST